MSRPHHHPTLLHRGGGLVPFRLAPRIWSRSGLLGFTGLAAVNLALALPIAALAQQPVAAPPAPKPPKAVDEIVVTGQSQQQDRVEIDRRSYSTAKTLQAQSGTVADLLRTVPSVDVDVQGNVSLRGDQNVTILVDGKPAAEFSGPSRSTAVQSLPADRYERVEVITNPSAADSAEGSGGIINLVSKQTHRVGYSGSAKFGLGERGQAIAGINGGYNGENLSLSGDLSLRVRDPASSRRSDVDAPIAADGTPMSREVTDNGATTTSAVARLSADYDVDARTRVGARLQAIAVHLNEAGGVLLTTEADDAPAGLFRQSYDGSIRAEGRLAGANFRRKLGDDQDLTADVRVSRVTLRTKVL
ncbi:MAG: TonB-dependent receptor plug domain-containing protein, partial [Proteobacteria bacterium]|nr:TonB-dependent receptor plug domain-containing protein [Pseudomonadota bacterium]